MDKNSFKNKLAMFNQNKNDKKPEIKKTANNQKPTQIAPNPAIKPNEKAENGGQKNNKEQIPKNTTAKPVAKPTNSNNKEIKNEPLNAIKQNNKANIVKPNTINDNRNKVNAPTLKQGHATPIIKNVNENGQKLNTTTSSSANSEASKLGKLISGKHPIYGSKKIGEEIAFDGDKLDIYDYPLNIEYSSKENSISVLFVGQSGSGKSTFINAYVNHILGITKDDKIRYKLIIGDARKEKDQTQSQTDFITIYNVRSLKYDNILFKLIDTPGAGDTRNEDEKEKSDLNKNKKEKEFLEMYNQLFSKEIGQLNSIVFVVKASENRLNAFQKKIVESITNLFADDIGKNCLAVLTHTDSSRIPDAVQLMKTIDIFKKKSKNEKWYFPVSSQSYFDPFGKDDFSVTYAQFLFTEKSLIAFTEILKSLKVYYTKETKRNLELKSRQEKIIKILKENILENLIINIKKLKDTEDNLQQKIEECNEKQKEIEKIKDQVNLEEETKRQIQSNFELHSNLKQQKLESLRKNKENIDNLKNKQIDLEQKIVDLTLQQEKAEKEKKEAEDKQKLLKRDIDDIEAQIKRKKEELLKKQDESLETEEIKNMRANLNNSKNAISQLESEIKLKQEQKETEAMKKLKNNLDEKQKQIDNLNAEINKKKSEGNLGEMETLQANLDELTKKSKEIDEQIQKEKKEKEDAIKKLNEDLLLSKKKFDEINQQIYNNQQYYNKEIEELQKILEKKKKQSDEVEI